MSASSTSTPPVLRVPASRLSVAPMMDRTDRHFRWLVRRISRRALLYTEMVVARAMLEGRARTELAIDQSQSPVALQLGGWDPEELGRCAAIAEDLGFCEVNLNCGCPSSRVRDGAFGVALMLEPERVADAVATMRSRTRLPVTVKCRIGADDRDRYQDLRAFVDQVAAAGCERFVVHARKAWLQGLSPAQNRTIPPLRYDDVARLAQERPDLRVDLNGGVGSMAQATALLQRFAGVMIGRAAYDDPMMLATADRDVFGDDVPPVRRRDVGEALFEYARAQFDRGRPLREVTRHALGLWRGVPGAARARGELSGPAGSQLERLRAAVDVL